jgi:hypothetical protein
VQALETGSRIVSIGCIGSANYAGAIAVPWKPVLILPDEHRRHHRII